jgi:alkanesulfonate monooxygenase SsuD/methylene tetrahydromethanopterin reductase-like flavin-dependent oxidoreductase (luciferase family)
VNIGVALTDAITDSRGNVVDETVRLARQADRAGLRSAWLGQRMDFDSVALAGIAGREVPGIAVGTSAVPIFARHPILVSSQAQTTQAATHGRYTLGLALGTKATTETAFGVAYDRPVARARVVVGEPRAAGRKRVCAPVHRLRTRGGPAPGIDPLGYRCQRRTNLRESKGAMAGMC